MAPNVAGPIWELVPSIGTPAQFTSADTTAKKTIMSLKRLKKYKAGDPIVVSDSRGRTWTKTKPRFRHRIKARRRKYTTTEVPDR